MSHVFQKNWRWSLQVVSSIPLFVLATYSISTTSNTIDTGGKEKSKCSDASSVEGSIDIGIGVSRLETKHFNVNGSHICTGAVAVAVAVVDGNVDEKNIARRISNTFTPPHSHPSASGLRPECKNEDEIKNVNLRWVKDSVLTKSICHHRQKLITKTRPEAGAGERDQIKHDLEYIHEKNHHADGFDPAQSFFEIGMTPRDRTRPLSYSDSSHKDIEINQDADVEKVEVDTSSTRESKDLPAIPAIATKDTTDSSLLVKLHTSQSPLPLQFLSNTVIIVPNLLTKEECELLVRDADRIINENRHPGVKTEKWAQFFRFEDDSKVIMDRMLREHVLTFIRLRLPNVAEELFQWRSRSRTPVLSLPASMQGEPNKIAKSASKPKPTPKGKPMDFYWDDPVVIKYTAGNRLAPHQDMRELTIVIPLQTSLRGGGTKFWLEGTSPENADTNGGILINPPSGSGVIFNGDMTHSGSSVLAGTRFVLMTSINLDDDENEGGGED